MTSWFGQRPSWQRTLRLVRLPVSLAALTLAAATPVSATPRRGAVHTPAGAGAAGTGRDLIPAQTSVIRITWSGVRHSPIQITNGQSVHELLDLVASERRGICSEGARPTKGVVTFSFLAVPGGRPLATGTESYPDTLCAPLYINVGRQRSPDGRLKTISLLDGGALLAEAQRLHSHPPPQLQPA